MIHVPRNRMEELRCRSSIFHSWNSQCTDFEAPTAAVVSMRLEYWGTTRTALPYQRPLQIPDFSAQAGTGCTAETPDMAGDRQRFLDGTGNASTT
jgi:hypothetical protein